MGLDPRAWRAWQRHHATSMSLARPARALDFSRRAVRSAPASARTWAPTAAGRVARSSAPASAGAAPRRRSAAPAGSAARRWPRPAGSAGPSTRRRASAPATAASATARRVRRPGGAGSRRGAGRPRPRRRGRSPRSRRRVATAADPRAGGFGFGVPLRAAGRRSRPRPRPRLGRERDRGSAHRLPTARRRPTAPDACRRGSACPAIAGSRRRLRHAGRGQPCRVRLREVAHDAGPRDERRQLRSSVTGVARSRSARRRGRRRRIAPTLPRGRPRAPARQRRSWPSATRRRTARGGLR